MNSMTQDHLDTWQFQGELGAIAVSARHVDEALDEALDESFPASDPIAVTIAKIPQRPVINLRCIEARRLVKADSCASERQEKA